MECFNLTVVPKERCALFGLTSLIMVRCGFQHWEQGIRTILGLGIVEYIVICLVNLWRFRRLLEVDTQLCVVCLPQHVQIQRVVREMVDDIVDAEAEGNLC